MFRKLLLPAVALLVLICAAPAHATTITASGAGPLPGTAQDLTGVSTLSEIVGTLDYPLGVDMFAIDITDAADFSAFTQQAGPFGVPDTELFLFNSGGFGVYRNDDASALSTLSCLPSATVSNPCSSSRPAGVGPTTDGVYYLAITRSANDPLSVGGDIFSEILSTDVTGPDPTMGGPDPINGWDNFVFTSPNFDLVNYDIVLSGTSPISATPEPATWTLIVTGLLFMFLRKKLRRPVALLS